MKQGSLGEPWQHDLREEIGGNTRATHLTRVGWHKAYTFQSWNYADSEGGLRPNPTYRRVPLIASRQRASTRARDFTSDALQSMDDTTESQVSRERPSPQATKGYNSLPRSEAEFGP